MKVKKGILWMMLIGSGMLTGISTAIIYTYFSMSKHLRTPEVLVLGMVIFAIAVILAIISFLSDTQ